MTRLTCLLALACLATVDLAGRQAGPASTSAQGAPADKEWSQWRGANRDGVSAETGLLQHWPKAGPPQAWRATGAGLQPTRTIQADLQGQPSLTKGGQV